MPAGGQSALRDGGIPLFLVPAQVGLAVSGGSWSDCLICATLTRSRGPSLFSACPQAAAAQVVWCSPPGGRVPAHLPGRLLRRAAGRVLCITECAAVAGALADCVWCVPHAGRLLRALYCALGRIMWLPVFCTVCAKARGVLPTERLYAAVCSSGSRAVEGPPLGHCGSTHPNPCLPRPCRPACSTVGY